MKQRNYNRGRRRKKNRLIRRLVVWLYRFACAGILAIIILLIMYLFQSKYTGEGQAFWSRYFGNQKLALEGEYPDSLITLLEKNPEAKDFVLHYPENKEKEFEIDLSGEITKGTVPLFLQWDERWGYEKYGSDFLAVTGCGPTCLSMVRCGLSGEGTWDPLSVAAMAQEAGFYVEGAGSSWNLMTDGAAMIGLTANNIAYDASHIVAELENGNPIICAMRPGDFTTSGHFIVLTGVNKKGMITVCDPNSKKNSKKEWKIEDLMPQIKNLWSYSYRG